MSIRRILVITAVPAALATMVSVAGAAKPPSTLVPEELISKLKELKDAYANAPNEIKKSAIFNEAREFDTAFFKKGRNTVTDWRGTVGSMTTQKGGTELALSVRVAGDGIKLKFAEGMGFGARGIPSKSPVYKAASDLTEGGCVIFSGKVNPKEDSISESGAMDAPEYTIKFTALKPCS